MAVGIGGAFHGAEDNWKDAGRQGIRDPEKRAWEAREAGWEKRIPMGRDVW